MLDMQATNSYRWYCFNYANLYCSFLSFSVYLLFPFGRPSVSEKAEYEQDRIAKEEEQGGGGGYLEEFSLPGRTFGPKCKDRKMVGEWIWEEWKEDCLCCDYDRYSLGLLNVTSTWQVIHFEPATMYERN